MVFTKRERIIIAATIAVLCLLVLDFYVLTPLLDTRADLKDEHAQLLAKLTRAKNLLKRRHLLAPKWRSMVDGGMRRDPAEAESQILRSLRNWSAETRVALSSQRPDRSAEKTELPEITIHVAGTGSMATVSRLLWLIETARVPIKIEMLQLGSRKDGTDDLSLHLKVSTLYVLSDSPSDKGPARGVGPGGGDR